LFQVNFGFESSEFSVLSKLEELKLIHCTKFEDFAHISQLTNLGCLIVTQSDAMMNTSSVSLLTNLSYLSLVVESGELLDSNLSHLVGLTKLTRINLRDARVEGNIESLSQFKNLTMLTLDVGVVSGDLSVLMNFTNLQQLSLCNNRDEHCAMGSLCGNVQVIAHLMRLKVLIFSGFSIQGNIAALSQCSGLEQLDLCALPQLQGDISVLSKLTKLNYCSLKVLPSINGDISVFSNISLAIITDCVHLTGNKSALVHLRSLTSFPSCPFLLINGCPNLSDEE
jgi:hypothetical protein